MRALLVLCLAACSNKLPKVELVASSCADVATCTEECDRGVVVACDRGGQISRDPTEKMAIYKKASLLWTNACDFGAPEACMNGATDLFRARGVEGATLQMMTKDKEACELVEIWGRGTGRPLQEPCP